MRVLHRVVVGVFILWTSAVALAPFLSSYRVIVSANTVGGWVLVCLAPRLYRIAKPPARAALIWLWTAGPIPKSLIAASLAVISFGVVVERRVALMYSGNHSGLLALSRARVEATPWLQERPDVKDKLIAPDNNGYDGQFMYAIAFDPFLRRFGDSPREYVPFIDAPPYRYGRVGYPLLTRIFALNEPARFPGVMIAIVYAGVFLAATCVGFLASRSGGSPWWGISIALVPGFWASFRGALPEPLAAGLAVAGYLCVRERRLVAGALLLAAACLVRETAVFFVLCIGSWLALSKQHREALKLTVVALSPLALWRLYIGSVFFPVWGLEAFWNPPDDFGVPFGGIVALWSDLAAGRYYPEIWEMRRGSLSFSFLVITGSALSWMMVRARASAVTTAAAIFGTMAICFNLKAVWVGTGNAERLTSDLFLFLALATPEFVSRSRGWRISLIGFWVAAGSYLLFGSLDASFTRESLAALLPW